MSDEKKQPTLADELPITGSESGILIKWDRESGDFKLFFEGAPLHISSFNFVMQAAAEIMNGFVNSDGMIVPSLPLDEQDKYLDEMPINQQEQEEQEESEEKDNIPPWLKKN